MRRVNEFIGKALDLHPISPEVTYGVSVVRKRGK